MAEKLEIQKDVDLILIPYQQISDEEIKKIRKEFQETKGHVLIISGFTILYKKEVWSELKL